MKNEKITLAISISFFLLIAFALLMISSNEQYGGGEQDNSITTRTATTTQKCNNGVCNLVLYSGIMNYFNGSEFISIDNSINNIPINFLDTNYEAYNEEGEYQVYYKEQSSGIVSEPVRFKVKDYTLTITPNSLKFLGQTNLHKKQSFLNVQNNYGTYENQFGDGIDLRYSYNNDNLKKELIINSLQELKDAIKSSPDIDDILQLKFTVKAYEVGNESNLNDLKIGSDRINFKQDLNDISTDQKIEFLDENNNTIYYFPQPYVEDSNGIRLMLNYTYDINRFANLVIKIEVPYTYLESAVYPVIIDPTITLNTANSGVLEDSELDRDNPATTNGADNEFKIGGDEAQWFGILKFNISSALLSDIEIINTTLQIYTQTDNIDVGESWNLTLHHILQSFDWTEDIINYNLRPLPTAEYNLTVEDHEVINTTDFGNAKKLYNLTKMMKVAYDNSDTNLSILFNTTYLSGTPGSTDFLSFRTKENLATNWRPTLIINYNFQKPQITIDQPKIQSYSNNNSLLLNYSITNITALDTCIYNVFLVAPFLEAIGNTTIADCLNTTFALQGGDEDYILTLWVNDSNGLSNEETITFYIRTVAPSIVLNSPTDNQYFDNGTNVYFNFTGSDVSEGLDTCELWVNHTGNWHNNYSWISPTNYTMNWTQVNVSEGKYKYNIWCNDTLDNSDWGVSNFTFIVDETNPNANITTANDTTVSGLAKTIEYNISDTNIDECYFTVRDSTGALHNYAENTSAVCTDTSRSVSSLVYGTYTIQIWAEDLAGNLNSSIITFTTRVPPVVLGGGGGITIRGVSSLEAVNHTITTTNLKNRMDLVLAKDSTKARKKQFLLSNTGLDSIELEIMCDTILINETELDLDITETDINICDYVFFEKTNYTVSPIVEQRIVGDFEVLTPKNSSLGDIYFFNIIAIRELEGETRFSKLGVSARVTTLGLLVKWADIPGQGDKPKGERIVYPVFLVAIVIGLFFSLMAFLIFRRAGVPFVGFFVSMGLFVGISILITWVT